MSLINCPECSKQISDKAEECPHCGLPSNYFSPQQSGDQLKKAGFNKVQQWFNKITGTGVSDVSNVKSAAPEEDLEGFDPKEFRNALISFERDHNSLFLPQQYIGTQTVAQFVKTYDKYNQILKNELIIQYLRTKASSLRIDETSLNVVSQVN